MQLRRAGIGPLVALAIAGCSGQVVGTPEPGSSSAAPASSAPPSPPVRTEIATTGEANFSSPTGNISCYVFDKPSDGVVSARCDIQQRRWQPPPKPADCEFDWAQGVSVGDTAHLVCASDTTLGATRQLAYGEAVKAGRFLCTSRETGMTCENTQTRHGFELSQESYRLF